MYKVLFYPLKRRLSTVWAMCLPSHFLRKSAMRENYILITFPAPLPRILGSYEKAVFWWKKPQMTRS